MLIKIKIFLSNALMVLLLVLGCTINFEVPDVSLKNIFSDIIDKKIDLAVNLHLTDDFKSTKWVRQREVDTFTMSIGEQLAKNSFELAEMTFSNVVVSSTLPGQGIDHYDAVITPKVKAIQRSFGATRVGESILVIVLEWKIEDLQNNIIWIDTIKGEGSIPSNSCSAEHAKQQIELAIKDLFIKSLKAIRSSPEINAYSVNTLKSK